MEKSPRVDISLHQAAREGDGDAVRRIVKEKPSLATKRDDDGRLPIHWATSGNHLEIVEDLVHSKDFDPDVQDASGWSPLLIAASIPDGDEVVELLLHRGSDVNLKSYNGQTALHLCASKANLAVARKLIAQRASARVKDRRGQLALHRAAAVGSVPLLNLLIEKQSPLNAMDSAGQTALHHAIAEGHGDAALALLKAGAESEKRDIDGFLAIDLAPDAKVQKYILQAAEREGLDMRRE